ncbi:MAG: glycosyltransferase family 2 protein [Rikenellaceae bacterium]
MKRVSLLIPAYNEEKSLDSLYVAISEFADIHTEYEWEFLFINDGSKDRTLECLRELREKDDRVCFVDLSRNFGKEVAMLAGFDHVTGDCAIILDADLQMPPRYIHEMLQHWEEGYDDVYARRLGRETDSFLRKSFSLLYYRMLERFTKEKSVQNVGDFRLLDRKCINTLKQLRESQRYTKGMYSWIGYRKYEITYTHEERNEGISSFNFFSLLSLAIEGVTSYTTIPLRLSAALGFLVSIFTFIYMVVVFVKTIIYGANVDGYPSLMLTILLLGGVQLISLGIIGEYLGRIFNETKRRPTYVVREFQGEQNSVLNEEVVEGVAERV